MEGDLVDLVCGDNARVVVGSENVSLRNQSEVSACWASQQAVDKVNLFIS
jgi:hypothetical protein